MRTKSKQTDLSVTQYPSVIHQFERQVTIDNRAIALSYFGDTVTYGELYKKSLQVSQFLIAFGIGPDDIVGICVERSLEMVIAVVESMSMSIVDVDVDSR